jgi:hypothetical protein
MKTRITLLITIVAALTVTGLNLVKVKAKITGLQVSLREQTTARTKAENDLAGTKGELERVNVALRDTAATLETAKAETKTLTAQVKEQTGIVKQLQGELASLQIRHDDARANLAAFESVMTIEQAVKSAKTIKDLQDELAVTKDERKMLAIRVARLNAKYGPGLVGLPAELEGKVLATDPKWQFVVLDAGESRGVKERGELLVSREGKLIGKVAIRRVEKDRCVADIVPGWNLGEIREGDKFIAAHVSEDL